MFESQQPDILYTAACFDCPHICVDVFGRNLIPNTTYCPQNETQITCLCLRHLTHCRLPVLLRLHDHHHWWGHSWESFVYCLVEIFFLKSSIFFWSLFFVLFPNFFCFWRSWSTMQSKGKIMINSVRNLPYPRSMMGVKSLLYPSLPYYFEETKMSGNIKACNDCRRSLFRFSSDFSRFLERVPQETATF